MVVTVVLQVSCALELVGLSSFAIFAGCTGSMKQYIVNLHVGGGVCLCSTSMILVSLDICAMYYEYCLFSPPITGKAPLKLPKTCTEYQAAHQSCVFNNTPDDSYIKYSTQLLACALAPTT